MPYIPHTEQDIQEMLVTTGVKSTEELFAEIPQEIRILGLKNLPEAMNEMEVRRLMETRAAKDLARLCFIGAGAYEHHIPAVVWDIASRGEFLTAYTPYQAEASQGTLQVIYEYQSMMCYLLNMDVANASMYDGASSLAEAVLMAVRINKKANSKVVLVPKALHPAYRKTICTLTKSHEVEIIEVPYNEKTGTLTLEAVKQASAGKVISALVLAQPNFFGCLEDVDALTNWAHEQGALVIGTVNPIAMGLLKAPGMWGDTGVDISAGDGQPLGIPLASGGPYFGYLCCKKAYVRQMPGRIVGRTVDVDGKPGFVLTLQAREQHIRRAKATSNICSNQALMATAATIYLSLLGSKGLKQVAKVSHANATKLRDRLLKIPGVDGVFSQPFFHEFIIRLNKPVKNILSALAATGIQAGYDLSEEYRELGNSLLICATETKTDEDIEFFAKQLEQVL